MKKSFRPSLPLSPLKNPALVVLLVFGLSEVVIAASVKSLSREQFEQTGDQSFWEVSVACSGNDERRVIQRNADGGDWCARDADDMCHSDKMKAAIKVCSPAYEPRPEPVAVTKAAAEPVEPAEVKPAEVKPAEPKPAEPAPVIPRISSVPPRVTQVKRIPKEDVPASDNQPDTTSAAAPETADASVENGDQVASSGDANEEDAEFLQQQIEIEEERIRIEQQKLDLRRKELELQKRELEMKQRQEKPAA